MSDPSLILSTILRLIFADQQLSKQRVSSAQKFCAVGLLCIFTAMFSFALLPAYSQVHTTDAIDRIKNITSTQHSQTWQIDEGGNLSYRQQEQTPFALSGSCGLASTLASAIRPVAFLCTAGHPSAVSGTGPWSWQCVGLNGGATVNCAAQASNVARCTSISGATSVTAGSAIAYSAACQNTTTYVWKLNGTQIAACNNLTSCNVPFPSAGSYTLTVAPSATIPAGQTATLSITAAAAASCSEVTGPTNVGAAASAQNYDATCSASTAGYVWRLNGGVISSCTGSSCSVNFPANTGTSTVAHSVSVAPANNNVAGATASLAITQAAAPVASCSSISGNATIAAAGGNFAYTANCTNTTAYVWTRDGVPVAGCSGNSCTMNFPANSAPATRSFSLSVAPAAGGAAASFVVTQAAAAVAPQCSGGISGPNSIAATGGSVSYAASCIGATGFTWSRSGVSQSCSGSSCTITFPGNTTATPVAYTVGATASNANGSLALPTINVTVAAAPATCSLDFNGDSTVNTTDALLFNRWLLGFRNDALVNGITPFPAGTSAASFATSVTSRIRLGLVHDFDNNAKVDAATDGLLFLRLTQGRTGAAVTNGALGTGALRNTHEAIRTHINSSCGTSFAPAASSIVLFDDFNGTALDTGKWTEVRAGTGVATVSGGTVTFGASASANTQGKVTINGGKIIIEGRFTGLETFRDTTISLVDASNGDYIIFGDTNYLGFGLYSAGTGQLAFSQLNQGGTTNVYKEYRLTIDGTSLLLERGTTLSSIELSRNVTLPNSIVGKTFFLRVSTAGPNYSPGTFDWVRVTTQ